MRKKDWADTVAESLQDVISEGDDEQLIEAISEELRKAFLTGLEHQQIGIAHLRAQRGELTSYYCTKKVPRFRDEQQMRPSELESESARNNYVLTWDGHHSVGGTKGKKKVSSS